MTSRYARMYRALSEQYEIAEDVVYTGGRGRVVRGYRRSDGAEVAIKVVSKRELNEWSQTAVAREVHVLKSVEHDNIVQFVDALEDQRHVYIITEYLRGGDLFARLQRQTMDELAVLKLVRQMLEAIKTLHDRGIAHRDLKLENFVFATGEDETEQKLKLIDFGLVYWRKPGSQGNATIPCGTIQYCAPEVAAHKEYVPEEVDMWGVGIVLYALLARKLPFYEQSRSGTISKIKNETPAFEGNRWKSVSSGTIALISKLLSKRGADRPCAEAATELLGECMRDLPLSDIEEEEDSKGRVVQPTGVSRKANMRVRFADSTDKPNDAKREVSGHKRQRSSSDAKAVLAAASAYKRRDKETELEYLSESEDEDAVEGESFFDGLCMAYGNI